MDKGKNATVVCLVKLDCWVDSRQLMSRQWCSSSLSASKHLCLQVNTHLRHLTPHCTPPVGGARTDAHAHAHTHAHTHLTPFSRPPALQITTAHDLQFARPYTYIRVK